MKWCIGGSVSSSVLVDEKRGSSVVRRVDVRRPSCADRVGVGAFDRGEDVLEKTPLGQRIGASPPARLARVGYEHKAHPGVARVDRRCGSSRAGGRIGSVHDDHVSPVPVDHLAQVAEPFGGLDAEAVPPEKEPDHPQVPGIVRGQENPNGVQQVHRSQRNLQEGQASRGEHRTPAVTGATDQRTGGADLWLGTNRHRIDPKGVEQP